MSEELKALKDEKMHVVRWNDTMQTINAYVQNKIQQLNDIKENKTKRVEEIMSEIATFQATVGMKLTLEEFKRYVDLHKQLQTAMKDIQHTCTKIQNEVKVSLKDSMAMVDRRRPLYAKFLKRSDENLEEENSDDSPLVFMVFIFISFLIISIITVLEADENGFKKYLEYINIDLESIAF